MFTKVFFHVDIIATAWWKLNPLPILKSKNPARWEQGNNKVPVYGWTLTLGHCRGLLQERVADFDRSLIGSSHGGLADGA